MQGNKAKKSTHIKNNIIFLGNRDDVYRLYQAMDAFVLPSRYEGLPVVGVEAQAAGLPCLFSDKMTVETKITDNAVFLSLESGAKEWSEVICSFVGDDRESDADILIDKCFDIKMQGNTLLQYYNNLIKQHIM